MVIDNALQKGYIKKITERGNVPENAVLISEKEAIRMQLNTIHQWTPKNEVWPFNLGHGILGAAAAVSGMYFNYYFRKRVNLFRYAQWSTYLPSALLPAIAAPIFHSVFITTDILVGKSSCSTCVETRASVMQMVTGVIYPLILAPLASFHFANSYGTYAIPPVKTALGDVFKLWWKFTKPIYPQITVLLIFQVITAGYITKKEEECIQDITLKQSNPIPNV